MRLTKAMRGFALVAGILVSAAICAPGQTLTNGTFDADVAGWTELGQVTLAWSDLDAAGSLNSGSAGIVSIAAAAADGSGAIQCVNAILAGTRYDAGSDVYIPSDQTVGGQAYVQIFWFDGASCTGTPLSFDQSSTVSTATPGQWLPVGLSANSPAGSVSARVRLTIFKVPAGGSLQANFDNTYFEAVPALIFEDGFEDGDTLAWSSTQG